MTAKERGGGATRRVAELAAVQQSEERLRLMVDAVPAMLTYIDTAERYLFSNLAYAQLLGLDRGQIVGRTMREVLGPRLHDDLRPFREQALGGTVASYERQHLRQDGGVADLSVTCVPDVGPHGAVQGFFCLTLDITRLKTLERRLAHMAQHDCLTGLPNRALFADRLEQTIGRYRRSGEAFAVAYLDVDHFKSINDTLGHAVGDRLLIEFAQRLRGCVRVIDTVARLGGDEFVLIVEGPITEEGAASVAAKVVAAMAAPFELGGAPVTVTTSLGIALAGDRAMPAEQLLHRADVALYRAKAKGRNTYEISR